MLVWLKKNKRMIIVYCVTIGVGIFLYACESQVRSLDGSKRFVTRAELQAELNAYIDRADIKFASLDRQDKFRQLVLNNAMLVVQGNTFNPVGLLTGLLGIYGVSQAAKNTTGAIKNARAKRNTRTNNTADTA